MYINRALLLLLAVVMVFLPAAIEWVMAAGAAWYRPYLLWSLLILLGLWMDRRVFRDDP